MDPRKLEHFLAVIEHGQFNLAATAMGVSQQAVSKAIAKLEDELGVSLFERSAFGATPTAFARTLERRAQTILAETRLANAELNALSGAKLGTLNLGIGLTLARDIMPRAIHRFRAQRPGIGIGATVDGSQVLYQRLLRGEIDLVASAPPEYVDVPADVTTVRLFMEQDLIMARPSHPLARAKHVTLSDLVPYPWIAPFQNYGLWLRICNAFGASGIAPPKDVIRTDSASLTIGMLTSEDCLCLLGREMMAHELRTGVLVAVKIEAAALAAERPALMAYRSKGPLSPAAKAFIPLLRDVCQGIYGA